MQRIEVRGARHDNGRGNPMRSPLGLTSQWNEMGIN